MARPDLASEPSQELLSSAPAMAAHPISGPNATSGSLCRDVNSGSSLETTISDVLTHFVAHPAQSTLGRFAGWDSGPLVLASIAVSAASMAQRRSDRLEAVCAAWLEREGGPSGSLALYGGIGGLYHGLSCAARWSARLNEFRARIQTSILDRLGEGTLWAQPAFDWPDYDLVTGPAGLLLVLAADPTVAVSALLPLATHLAALLASDEMVAFRIAGCREDALRNWNEGAINLGLAHGIGGPVAALTAYVRLAGAAATPVAKTLEQAAEWLFAQRHEDERGIVTWAPKRNDARPVRFPASRREAWCYGAPGIAWVLWDAGTAIGRDDLANCAADIFTRFADAFDPSFHLDDSPDEQLAICHGAAGTLLIADAFARHARLDAAGRIAEKLECLLGDRLAEIASFARADPSLLSGGMGILATLLTRAGGERHWLSALALR